MATAEPEQGLWRLKLGIADVDAYDMLFYAHYPRYSQRAVNATCLPEPTDPPPSPAPRLHALPWAFHGIYSPTCPAPSGIGRYPIPAHSRTLLNR